VRRTTAISREKDGSDPRVRLRALPAAVADAQIPGKTFALVLVAGFFFRLEREFQTFRPFGERGG